MGIPLRTGVMRAWLFDAYPDRDGMVVWFLDAHSRPHRLWTAYHPAFYVGGPPAVVEALRQLLARRGIAADLTPTTRLELYSGAELPVVRVAVRRPLLFPAAVQCAASLRRLTLYTCDLSVPQLFFYETGLFPLGFYQVEAEDGAVRSLEPLTRPEDLEYEAPPLVVMRLRLAGDPINPTHGRGTRAELEVSVDGDAAVLTAERPADLLQSLNHWLRRYDPDVLLSDWGDAFLLPRLRRVSAQVGVPLLLNRDADAGVRTRRSRSYITYGKTVFTAGAQMLHGRWHLDLRNSFLYSESEITGLLEIARLSRLPVQYLGRTSIGTAISSMQLDRAVRGGILVPWHKSEPEAFKTAEQLLLSDKGGLTYQPLVGIFEGVGELDFSSMYPMMMARFNISPETIGCACCQTDGDVVPEIGYTVCRRRRGLVPEVLDHLLERRMYYKRRRRETTGSDRALYDQRQTALKWTLVTSFGYLGYRNARYGRIEAHESTTAFSREMLLRAKEHAEARGYRMLHALVDSMWLQKPGATPDDYERLAYEVTQITNLPILVEGVYDWVAFLPSRLHKGVGVPNRYMGVFEDGSTKVRGIEVRRGDVPALVEQTQARMLDVLFGARTLVELHARVERALAILEEALVRLRAGDVEAADLALTTVLSREPHEYSNNHPVAVAARLLSRSRIRLHPGEAIQYVITDADAALPDERVRPLAVLGSDWVYDADRYAELLCRAGETVLELLGYDRERLWKETWVPLREAGR